MNGKKVMLTIQGEKKVHRVIERRHIVIRVL